MTSSPKEAYEWIFALIEDLDGETEIHLKRDDIPEGKSYRFATVRVSDLKAVLNEYVANNVFYQVVVINGVIDVPQLNEHDNLEKPFISSRLLSDLETAHGWIDLHKKEFGENFVRWGWASGIQYRINRVVAQMETVELVKFSDLSSAAGGGAGC